MERDFPMIEVRQHYILSPFQFRPVVSDIRLRKLIELVAAQRQELDSLDEFRPRVQLLQEVPFAVELHVQIRVGRHHPMIRRAAEHRMRNHGRPTAVLQIVANRHSAAATADEYHLLGLGFNHHARDQRAQLRRLVRGR